MNALRRTAFSAPVARRAFSSTPRAQLAKMTIIGRLGAEPEPVTTNSGREMVRYVLGTNTGRRENNETSWFQVASFDEGPRRDFLLGLPKGTLMHLEADAKMNVYENSEGQKVSRLNLTQRNIEILSRPRTQESSEGPMSAESA
ncbi:Inorganic polyphosphate/ATP-NAD kinase predicted [Neofusicoccum parvum]|uniref:Inorganic polyphosphate/ATP-NAD kinase predicted n=2 Tax=Neofusicoccum parvum TaxID=310453 RepID=A0ACB5SK21_9PEZI|nr:putative ssdna binding protein [Neofusicoccum parvum UCRNP2]GME43171.1 Inorganic polyphosphate/ATP-NAD kinase predicted [Neofusicoccum parvum]GME53467.1 Inorganic polyphosphate/ATP-NAD kinase predicted [Neofusicoccum parvum]